MEKFSVIPTPCAHIWEYYQHKWEGHHCIAYNLLRFGYQGWAEGSIYEQNNLYEP